MMILCLIGSTARTSATIAKKECENFKDYDKAKEDVCQGLDPASYANGIYRLYALAQYMAGGATSGTVTPMDVMTGITKYVSGTKISAAETLPVDKAMEQLTDLKLHNSMELDKDEPDGRRNAWAFTARVSKTTIVICFKGTEMTKVMDWKANTKATSIEANFGVRGGKKYKEGKRQKIKVHKGFWGYYRSNKKSILAAVEKMMDSDTTKIIVTGHSLGGAQANICAVDFALMYPNKEIALWTFGSPRVFKAETVQEANKIETQGKNSAHRIFAKGDMVTSLPLSPMGFSHSSKGLYLRPEETAEKNQLRDCGMNDNARGLNAANHGMDSSYIPRLKAVCKDVTVAQRIGKVVQRLRKNPKLGRSKQQDALADF